MSTATNPHSWSNVRDALLTATPTPPADLGRVAQTGLYAWWDLAGTLAPRFPIGFPDVDARRPLYIGLAERQTLGARGLLMHLKTTRMSTLRRSLAALLWKELDLLPGITDRGAGKFSIAPAQEQHLTEWMLTNLRVTWVTHDSPGTVEKPIIFDVLPPFNDRFAHHGGYYKAMSDLRNALRQAAREGRSL